MCGDVGGYTRRSLAGRGSERDPATCGLGGEDAMMALERGCYRYAGHDGLCVSVVDRMDKSMFRSSPVGRESNKISGVSMLSIKQSDLVEEVCAWVQQFSDISGCSIEWILRSYCRRVALVSLSVAVIVG